VVVIICVDVGVDSAAVVVLVVVAIIDAVAIAAIVDSMLTQVDDHLII